MEWRVPHGMTTEYSVDGSPIIVISSHHPSKEGMTDQADDDDKKTAHSSNDEVNLEKLSVPILPQSRKETARPLPLPKARVAVVTVSDAGP